MTKQLVFTAFQKRLVNTKTAAFEAAYDEGIFNYDLIAECFREWKENEENY